MEPLGGLDAAFFALESTTEHLHVGAVLVLEPPEGKRSLFSPATRFAQIRHTVGERLDRVPRFRQRTLGGPLQHPLWVDDAEFSLDHHLRRAGLPAPGGQRELEDLVAELMSQPLDLERPLWEMTVVEGLAGGRTALVAKVHHAVLDGVSGAALLASYLDARPRVAAEPAGGWEPVPAPSLLDRLRREAVERPLAALAALDDGMELLATRTPGQALAVPPTSLNGRVSSRRTFATVAVPLEGLRSVGRRVGATVNEVVLAATGEAVSTLLRRRGEVPEGPLVAMVPVSVRRRGSAADLGNRLSAHFVALSAVAEPGIGATSGAGVGTGSGSRPAVGAAGAAATARRARALGAVMEDLGRLLAPAVVGPLARLLAGVRPPANLVVSHVVGPETPLWCAGGRLAELYPVGPVAAGIGLNITAVSYCGWLQVGLLGCRRLVPDVGDLAILLDEAFARLVEPEYGAGHG